MMLYTIRWWGYSEGLETRMNHVSVFRAALLGVIFLMGLAGPSFAEGLDALQETRKALEEEYNTAARDVQLMKADHKIAMEQLKITLTRKDLGKTQTPEMTAAYSEKVRTLTQQQDKQMAPLIKKRSEAILKLRENTLAQRKVTLDARRKELSSQGKSK